MSQHNNIVGDVREYTRTDFTALRFKLLKVQSQVVFDLYQEEELEKRGVKDPTELNLWLDELRDYLVEKARLANPRVSAILDDARRRGSWPKGVLDFIIQSGEQSRARPKLTDGISEWFKPLVFKSLEAEGLRTLGDLKLYIETRGGGWYRPIPRLGAGKARVFEQWLATNSASLGSLVLLPEAVPDTPVVLGNERSPCLVPMERMLAVVQGLDGSTGVNRNPSFCLISARNDLDAIRAYLYRFRGRPGTYRSYQKELERFLLWCVLLRTLPMSSVLTEDCEAYKDFLRNPDDSWRGPKAPRNSPRWRPFATDQQRGKKPELAAQTQRYAVQVIRTFFEWLVRVRYLGGNPWITVADPMVQAQRLPLKTEKALSESLWTALTAPNGLLDRACEKNDEPRSKPGALAPREAGVRGAQYRLARAVIILLGFSGVRRQEATTATRGKLQQIRLPDIPKPIWGLDVLGKRQKWRRVYLPDRAISALEAHWADRGQDFHDPENSELALLSPVVIPPIPKVRDKQMAHADEVSTTLSGAGFDPAALYKVLTRALHSLALDDSVELSREERDKLLATSPHAFRHTFATRAVAHQMSADVLQKLLGHASPVTTSIYVQAEDRRAVGEASKFFEK